MIRDLNVFESSFDVVFLYALNFDMIKDVLMCNFFLFWMGQESFKDM